MSGTGAEARTAVAPDAELLVAVRRVPLMASLSRQGVEHYARTGTVLRLPAGGHVADEGDARSWLHLLLAGRVEWTRRIDGTDVLVLTHSSGDHFGHEPLLLDIPVPVTGRAVEPCWLLRLEVDAFWELLASCPEVRRELLTTVSQRVGALESVSQQQAKLTALGTMAAGLAHELNNPAAAVRSGAGELARVLEDLVAGAPDGAAELYRRGLEHLAAGAPDPSGLEGADAEDQVADWLDAAGVADPWDAAPVLVRAGLSASALDALRGSSSDGHSRGAGGADEAARWLVAHLRAADALHEVRDGAARIGDLVAAMRDYTHLDQGPLQDVDVARGLESTLTILGHQLRRGAVTLVRDYAPDLPQVPAHGSELNQVWTNLVSNALDALDGTGTLTLRTRRDGDHVVVQVRDTGPGVPPELLARVFEPYFTTKPVGAGTGLGLDVSRRIVAALGGQLRLDSSPGGTVVTVRLPVPPDQQEEPS